MPGRASLSRVLSTGPGSSVPPPFKIPEESSSDNAPGAVLVLVELVERVELQSSWVASIRARRAFSRLKRLLCVSSGTQMGCRREGGPSPRTDLQTCVQLGFARIINNPTRYQAGGGEWVRVVQASIGLAGDVTQWGGGLAFVFVRGS